MTDKPPSLASLQPKRKYTRRPKDAPPIVIEKGIEIPPPTYGHKKYPWDLLEVGDSFFVPNAPKSLAGSAAHKSKDGPNGYTARKVTVRGVEGVRVWRIK